LNFEKDNLGSVEQVHAQIDSSVEGLLSTLLLRVVIAPEEPVSPCPRTHPDLTYLNSTGQLDLQRIAHYFRQISASSASLLRAAMGSASCVTFSP
jgi:hypothetical protein